MAGFASSPFAVTPFGAGTPATATAPPSAPAEHAAYIDPLTKEYVLDDEGELARMPETRQRMLLAVTTIKRSSSAEINRGIELPKKVGDDLQRESRSAVLRATEEITRDKSARLDPTTAKEIQNGRVEILIPYTDLKLGTEGHLDDGSS